MDVNELEGAELDLAVAQASKAWGTAHELFPTLTLDPTFSAAEIRNGKCYLIPHNPMRQDPQVFDPSVSWWLGGPIIERERITIVASMNVDMMGPLEWHATVRQFEHYIDESLPFEFDECRGRGPTPLIAAMRAFVASKDV